MERGIIRRNLKYKGYAAQVSCLDAAARVIGQLPGDSQKVREASIYENIRQPRQGNRRQVSPKGKSRDCPKSRVNGELRHKR